MMKKINFDKTFYEIHIYEKGTHNKIDTLYIQAKDKSENQIIQDLNKVFNEAGDELDTYDFYVIRNEPAEKE